MSKPLTPPSSPSSKIVPKSKPKDQTKPKINKLAVDLKAKSHHLKKIKDGKIPEEVLLNVLQDCRESLALIKEYTQVLEETVDLAPGLLRKIKNAKVNRAINELKYPIVHCNLCNEDKMQDREMEPDAKGCYK